MFGPFARLTFTSGENTFLASVRVLNYYVALVQTLKPFLFH
jgi:hypothetical protein